MFMLSILLMVIPTFALAFIPSYESIGYLCIVLLMLIRIAQGISIGGGNCPVLGFLYMNIRHKDKKELM